MLPKLVFPKLSLAAVCLAACGFLVGAPPASAQFYNPYYRQQPQAYPIAPVDRRFVPLDEDDDDIAPPPRRAPRTQAAQGRSGARFAALPPDADPAYSSAENYDDEVDRTQSVRRVVADPTGQPGGTITINTRVRKLYLSLGDGRAMEYGIGVGRQGFEWKGTAQIGRKAVWPGWTPPKEMLQRRPDLPAHMEGGMDNPLGARALYLFKGAKDTLFRIHGTNEPDSIGHAVSSGCIRMNNVDVIDLYQRVSKGATVVVI